MFRDLGLKTAQSVGRGIQVPNMDLRLKEGSRRSEMGQGLVEVKGQLGAILKHPLYVVVISQTVSTLSHPDNWAYFVTN